MEFTKEQVIVSYRTLPKVDHALTLTNISKEYINSYSYKFALKFLAKRNKFVNGKSKKHEAKATVTNIERENK